jgi:hypothetical protein
MTVSVDRLPVRLHVTVCPVVDIEPPYDDAAPVAGALALALPATVDPAPPGAEPDGPAAPLHLVPPPPAAPGRDVDPADEDELFAAQRTPRAQLPDPAPRAAMLARAILETLAGDRPVSQLLPWTTTDVYDDLEALVDPRTARPWASSVRRIRVCEPVPGVAEVAAVVQRGGRAAALALRLEGLDGRWLLTALSVG